MDQLTGRGFDKALARRIKEVAKTQRISLNQAAVMLLRQATGLDLISKQPERIGDSLNKLIGAWTNEEAEELLKSIRPLETIDSELWK
jgi:hypothetical protein